MYLFVFGCHWQCGADALRMALGSYVQCTPGLQIHLDAARAEHYRAFGTKLWNAAKFVLSHVHGDKGNRTAVVTDCGILSFRSQLSVPDRWILSQVARAHSAVHDGITSFNIGSAVSAVGAQA
jgi:valyl-tRNA synthetase